MSKLTDIRAALYDQHASQLHTRYIQADDYDDDGMIVIDSHKFKIGKDNTLRTVTDDEFMLMPAILYGFSLGDRRWRRLCIILRKSSLTFIAVRFNVDLVEDIIWNPDAFDHLDIPDERKEIVQSLTESHYRNAGGFDDFIEGKGIGLIFNLHGESTSDFVDISLSLYYAGPPGVGKTLTAEATSEG